MRHPYCICSLPGYGPCLLNMVMIWLAHRGHRFENHDSYFSLFPTSSKHRRAKKDDQFIFFYDLSHLRIFPAEGRAQCRRCSQTLFNSHRFFAYNLAEMKDLVHANCIPSLTVVVHAEMLATLIVSHPAAIWSIFTKWTGQLFFLEFGLKTIKERHSSSVNCMRDDVSAASR